MTENQDAFSKHELLDRTYLAQQFFEDNVLNHPVCKSHLELQSAAQHVNEVIAHYYNFVGKIITEEST